MNKKILYILAIAAVANLIGDVNADWDLDPVFTPKSEYPVEPSKLSTELQKPEYLKIKAEGWNKKFLDHLIDTVGLEKIEWEKLPASLKEATEQRASERGILSTTPGKPQRVEDSTSSKE